MSSYLVCRCCIKVVRKQTARTELIKYDPVMHQFDPIATVPLIQHSVRFGK
jgi:hypothetical protein